MEKSGPIKNNASMVEDLLKLCCSAPLMCSKIGFTTQVKGVGIGPIAKVVGRQTKFIKSSDAKSIKRLLSLGTADRQLGAKSWQVVDPIGD